MLSKFIVSVVLVTSCFAMAAPLKLNLVAGEGRKAFLMSHWDNWEWKKADSSSMKFGDVTIRISATSPIDGVSRKALLEAGMHMGVSGIATTGGEDLVISIAGLSPGAHSLALYQHEVRDRKGGSYEIQIDGQKVMGGVKASDDVSSDYDVACSYFPIIAAAGNAVEVRIRPEGTHGVVLNGLEIDASNPKLKSTKPAPANDDEHVDPQGALTWTSPAVATAHLLYFGTDAQAVENATQQSPEFLGSLKETRHPLGPTDHMKTYYWRVDEVIDPKSPPIKGELWRLRTRFLAFPTAEGYGQFARGGRGGRVIEVTNLEDYDKDETPIPGSYRAAVEAEGPRTIVFRVSGVIFLKRDCAVRNGYVTIAGQTAPGDGICLANYSAGMATNDAVVRFMRVRVGDKARKAMDGMGLGSSDDSIIDHCSISWAMDEGTSSRGGHNITFQWNIISEMLQHGYHYNAGDRSKFETHAFAGSISGNIGSYHHNLLAHCTDRNWSLAGGLDQAGKYAGRLDIRNNVVYNWTARTTDGGVKDLNYANNYYKPYPKQEKYVKWLLRLDPIRDEWGAERVFMSGNVMEGFDYEHDNWKAYDHNNKERRSRDELIALVKSDQPLYPSYVKEESAREAYPRVLAGAGAILPQRDVIDTRIAEEVRTGTVHYMGTKAAEWAKEKGHKNNPNFPGIIDTPTDVRDAEDSPVKPWPNYKIYNVPVDSDHDGMPDDWEKARGLNPSDAEDRNGDFNHDGYTNLEKYLNSLTGEYVIK